MCTSKVKESSQDLLIQDLLVVDDEAHGAHRKIFKLTTQP